MTLCLLASTAALILYRVCVRPMLQQFHQCDRERQAEGFHALDLEAAVALGAFDLIHRG